MLKEHLIQSAAPWPSLIHERFQDISHGFDINKYQQKLTALYIDRAIPSLFTKEINVCRVLRTQFEISCSYRLNLFAVQQKLNSAASTNYHLSPSYNLKKGNDLSIEFALRRTPSILYQLASSKDIYNSIAYFAMSLIWFLTVNKTPATSIIFYMLGIIGGMYLTIAFYSLEKAEVEGGFRFQSISKPISYACSARNITPNENTPLLTNNQYKRKESSAKNKADTSKLSYVLARLSLIRNLPSSIPEESEDNENIESSSQSYSFLGV